MRRACKIQHTYVRPHLEPRLKISQIQGLRGHHRMFDPWVVCLLAQVELPAPGSSFVEHCESRACQFHRYAGRALLVLHHSILAAVRIEP
jgi:hypothetical protein